jgi:hypothetical protein
MPIVNYGAVISILCSRALKKSAEVPSRAKTPLSSCLQSNESKYYATPDIWATRQIVACSLRYRGSGRSKPSFAVKVTRRGCTRCLLRHHSLLSAYFHCMNFQLIKGTVYCMNPSDPKGWPGFRAPTLPCVELPHQTRNI